MPLVAMFLPGAGSQGDAPVAQCPGATGEAAGEAEDPEDVGPAMAAWWARPRVQLHRGGRER